MLCEGAVCCVLVCCEIVCCVRKMWKIRGAGEGSGWVSLPVPDYDGGRDSSVGFGESRCVEGFQIDGKPLRGRLQSVGHVDCRCRKSYRGNRDGLGSSLGVSFHVHCR